MMIVPHSLLTPPAPEQMVVPDRALGRHFMLFIDTEEEFDWLAPFDRAATRVTAVGGMAHCQDYLTAAGVRPVYLADYPILDSDPATALLGRWIADGTADVGAHLHPWVNPPHDGIVSIYNSFVGNLPEGLERAKLESLCARMEVRLGMRPIVYRAGRYGAGANTARLLEEAGFRLDCSVRSRFDYSAQGGPDFSDMPLLPYRTGPDQMLIELPLSTAFVGHLRTLGRLLHPLTQASRVAAAGLSRTGLFARIPLTPEGVTAAQCVAAIDALIEDEVPVLSFSFHSPTVEPGNTPYVRTIDDLKSFYRWWDVVLDHLARRSVRPLGLDGFFALVGNGAQSEHTCQAS